MVEASKDSIEHAFKRFIQTPDFPCVGAKSSLAKGNMQILNVHGMDESIDDALIHNNLRKQADSYRRDGNLFQSLAILFDHQDQMSEQEFECVLWQRLQALSKLDQCRGYKPDKRVSADPANPDFSLSFAGVAFFVVGLHPCASRAARRFSYPAIIFNIHDQFEQMRSTGLYQKLQPNIAARDYALAGSRNPMLAPHGEISAARQYSGRKVEDDWVCPYQRLEGAEQ
jgi:uncharacterized protein